MKTRILISLLFLVHIAFAQTDAEKAAAQANNPLANMKALNFHFNYITNLTNSDMKVMSANIRYAQPIGEFLIRASLPTWTFNLRDEAINMPLGIGMGKVVKMGNTVVNLFIEPQFSLYSKDANQANFQIFGGINTQFLGGN